MATNGTSSNAIPRVQEPLGKPTPYIIPAYEGESITIPGTKSTFRILASAAETDGLMSVFGMDGTLADPPGFHYHNEAHDVFMCTKGRLKVWAGDRCKILYPGDFAYVPPGVVHQPMLLDKGINETVGLVTPGQWVDFFRFVSERYDGVVADEFDSRNPGAVFGPKIKEIKEKYDVVFQPQFKGAEVSDWSAEDEKIPEGQEAYFLKANTGPCHLLEGILSRPFITTKQSTGPTGNFAVTSIESSNRLTNSILSKPFSFSKVHQVYHILDGAISLTVNGGAGNLVRSGESAFIPAGTDVAIEFVDRYVRFWAYSSGDGLETLIAEAGGAFEGTVVPDQIRAADVEKVRKVAESLNVAIEL
ncbi:RmlC-like cupin domain-containing protein [Pyrenochaeta sp. MPI-SDFR-AT-0127]|nr:RmlC-like cupin domain-containing protein [Pyrenochaeta sp. MPI-SDFR-AT-0127]